MLCASFWPTTVTSLQVFFFAYSCFKFPDFKVYSFLENVEGKLNRIFKVKYTKGGLKIIINEPEAR